ncbi:BCD family MFS transporter [Pontixanthobacter aestiaquae]|uniref:MFS transporter n=1 Tax=Pontixanthobacter aestiaquae TaxID=1509367 RepID=A0A844ZB11_9SPHN|nr:BCD family MFS transporter [Pontixanthobacter aestiaquae]MDN3644786.1 BCD family MFS transporter [Pontixanthobacter aestiaquae]MXO84207.1 MFS transporter [Pontixanthobacter aestiaquae]
MSERPSSATFWQGVGTRFLPFADAASEKLPLSRILRLALFQVSVGIAAVLLNGTLNRVMIVELETPTWIVALMIAIPLLIAPFRALIGYRSDTHKSVLGWRRVPYIWFGTLAQFGGLAIMPFALVLLTRPDTFAVGLAAACLAFLLTGAGMHVTQTAGLALATDLAPEDKRPSVVALLYVMLLVGMMAAAFTIGNLLLDFTKTGLIQIIQGAAALTMILNIVALWKQEARNAAKTMSKASDPKFSEMWASFTSQPNTKRLLLAIGVGAMAFAMQDALLEPYGGEILGLSVGSTTSLTGAWSLGALIAFGVCANRLPGGSDPLRLAGFGVVVGIAAFLMTLFAGPLASAPLLFAGAGAIGFGTGLFSVGTMIAAMGLVKDGAAGMALGAWGAVQASTAGLGIALGGLIRDGMTHVAMSSAMGSTLADRGTGYGTVYALEIVLLLVTLLVLGPVVGRIVSLNQTNKEDGRSGLGLREFPT